MFLGVGKRQACQSGSVNAVQTGVRADPHRPFPIDRHFGHSIGAQSLLWGEALQGSPIEIGRSFGDGLPGEVTYAIAGYRPQ